jgi:hypothetical protein
VTARVTRLTSAAEDLFLRRRELVVCESALLVQHAELAELVHHRCLSAGRAAWGRAGRPGRLVPGVAGGSRLLRVAADGPSDGERGSDRRGSQQRAAPYDYRSADHL